MNILEFIQQFPDEGACRLKFKEQRDQIGIVCSKCNCKEHYW
ncbi:MAG TPA: IS1595 family transposase, partial [Prolixibacteraceae bacterium]|nr:IS1595 family transposase [Prolixibacteraceae bacterium]